MCHVCADQPKFMEVSLVPPTPMSGIKWYFEWPQYPNLGGPVDWVKPNRNTAVDPELLDIIEVYKFKVCDNKKKHVRPLHWESSMTVHCVLAAADGSSIETSINLFCFNMNKEWRSHNISRYIEDWISQGRSHEKFIGYVLNAPQTIPHPVLR